MNKIERLEIDGISKSFGDVHANSDISFSINRGEILGLLGENGAGKTTLMNILYGLYQPDTGRFVLNGKEVVIRSPRDSISMGIGMVHQHFKLVQNHTVEENVLLGMKDVPFFFPAGTVRRRMAEFSKRYGLEIEGGRKVWQLSAGEQQRVEIVKTLMHGADLLILDEPTSVLTPQETEELFAILKLMKAEGHLVILISHKLEEIMEICDRVVALRKGKVVGGADTADVDKPALARMMVGREVLFSFTREEVEPGEDILQVRDLTVPGDRGEEAVRDVSFTIRENEIFGIAGVSGNGQRELVEALTGLRKPSGGSVLMNGREIAGTGAKNVHCAGISHVPEERIKFGIVPNMALYENSVLKRHCLPPFAGSLFMNYPAIRQHADTIVAGYQVSTPSISVQAKNLSGGNIQKMILGREISSEPRLLVAAHPTYGLDVGATEYIRKQLLALRSSGAAVLLVSEDLDEIFELCDRTAVMFSGRFMGIVDPEQVSLEEIGLMMAGSSGADGGVD